MDAAHYRGWVQEKLTQGESDAYFEPLTLNTPLPASNVGFQLMLQMGWKSGTGLGLRGQGRTDPVPITDKRDTMGLGRMSMEVEHAAKTTETRRLLEAEMDLTPELEQKWQNEAERKESLERARAEMTKVFLCNDCNKQYTQVSEYDNHLSSYDHHHTKRLRELKRQTNLRTHGAGKKKEKKKEEKEMQRIMQLAAAQQQKAGIIPGAVLPPVPTFKPSSTSGSGGAGFKPVGESAGFKPLAPVPAASGGGGFIPMTTACRAPEAMASSSQHAETAVAHRSAATAQQWVSGGTMRLQDSFSDTTVVATFPAGPGWPQTSPGVLQMDSAQAAEKRPVWLAPPITPSQPPPPTSGHPTQSRPPPPPASRPPPPPGRPPPPSPRVKPF